MSFAVAAEAYDRFMGRYSTPLAPRFLDFARVESGPVLDVGCGPGALTAVLVERFGADAVAAADPSEPFVAAARERHPGVRVELAPAEELPFERRGSSRPRSRSSSCTSCPTRSRVSARWPA